MNWIIAATFALKLWCVGDVPPEYGWYTYEAAVEYEVPPDILGALLIAEHRGHYPTDSVENGSGASGLFQTTPMWAKRIGYEPEDLFDPRVSTEVAASVVAYSLNRHEKCSRGHHWVAHWFCKRGSRNRCSKPTRRFKRIMKSLQPGAS